MSGPADIQRFPTSLATADSPGAMSANLAATIFADGTGKLVINNDEPNAAVAVTVTDLTPHWCYRGKSTEALLTSSFTTGGDFGTAINDDIYWWGYNVGGEAAQHPKWTEQTEFHYYWGSVDFPDGLLEKHWNYVSIDRNTAFRPWMWQVNLTTHLTSWVHDEVAAWTVRNHGNTKRISYNGTTGLFAVENGTCTAATFESGSVRTNGLYCLGDLGGGSAVGGLISADFPGAAYPGMIHFTVYSNANTPSETMAVGLGKVGIGTAAPDTALHVVGTWGSSTLKPAGIHIQGNIPGISIEASNAGNNRNFALLSNWLNAGVLDVAASSTAGGAPSVDLMRFDGVNATVILPQLAGTGKRALYVAADGTISL